MSPKNTGRGSAAGSPVGPFLIAKTQGGSFRPIPRKRGRMTANIRFFAALPFAVAADLLTALADWCDRRVCAWANETGDET